MRVLFSSTSGYGHVLPMLPLARAFVGAGHQVLWAANDDAGRVVTAAGLDTAPVGMDGATLRAALRPLTATAVGLPPPDRARYMFPAKFAALLTPPTARDLLPLARTWGPDLMIHEQGELAAPLVGAVVGVPTVTHSFGGAVPVRTMVEAGERLADLWIEHGLEPREHAGCFSGPYLDLCPTSVRMTPLDHIGDVRPLRPVADAGSAPADLPTYLEPDDRPLVYVTLGTVRGYDQVLRPALEALWDLPVRVVVAVGPGGDIGALGPQPPQVHVEGWVDQPRVLDHASIVVSHAGSGTFYGALARGLPQLCLPQAADQFRNAAGGERVGAALVLLTDPTTPAVTSAATAAAVARLLADDGFRRAADVVADEIAAMPSPAEVAARLAS